MLYLKLFQKLAEKKIQYLVAGGIAVNLHGYVRATIDLDLVLYLNQDNIEKFIAIAKELEYEPSLPIPIEKLTDEATRLDWINNRNMIAFPLRKKNNPIESVDILIHQETPFSLLYKNKKTFDVNGTGIDVMSKKDLIHMKEKVGRDRDLQDIRALKEIEDISRGK